MLPPGSSTLQGLSRPRLTPPTGFESAAGAAGNSAFSMSASNSSAGAANGTLEGGGRARLGGGRLVTP